MPYKISMKEPHRYLIEFFDEPNYIHGLRMAPESREECLNSGTWLILVFPIWARDQSAIGLAMDTAIANQGSFNLGVRLLESEEENTTWLDLKIKPQTMVMDTSIVHGKVSLAIHGWTGDLPLWIWLQEGTVIETKRGSLSVEALSELIAVGRQIGDRH